METPQPVPVKRKRGRPRKHPLPGTATTPAAAAAAPAAVPAASAAAPSPSTKEPPQKRAKRTKKQSKDLQFVYEFDDIDKEEDGSKKQKTADEAAQTQTTSTTPTASSQADPKKSDGATSSSHLRCSRCHAHNALRSCSRGCCSLCCKLAEGGPCEAHDKGKTKREPAPPPPPPDVAKPPPPAQPRKRGRPRKYPLPPGATPPSATPSPVPPSPSPKPDAPEVATAAATAVTQPVAPTTAVKAPSSTTSQVGSAEQENKPQVESEKSKETEEVDEAQREAMRLKQERDRKFYSLYRTLQRMAMQEAKKIDRLESPSGEGGESPREGHIHGNLYRKVPEYLLQMNFPKKKEVPKPAVADGDKIDGAEKGKEKASTEEESKAESTVQSTEGASSQTPKPTAERADEYHWIDEGGWPLVEDVFIGAEFASEWEAWLEEFKKGTDGMERGDSRLGSSSFSIRGSAAAAESALASGMPGSTSSMLMNSRGLRRYSDGNGLESFNERFRTRQDAFDTFDDDEEDDDDYDDDDLRRLSVSFDSDTIGSRPRFMSRHAAKMRKRYPALADRTLCTSYRDRRQLMRDISVLDSEFIPGLLKIIFRQMPDCFAARQMLTQKLDLDVSFLTPATLSRVEDYVYTIVGKRQNQMQQRRRSMSLHASTGSLRSTSPPLTPAFDHRRRIASSTGAIGQGSDDDRWARDDDNEDDFIDVTSANDSTSTTASEPQPVSRGRGRPRRDSSVSGQSGKGSKHAKGSSKVRKTERSSSPRTEEARIGRRRSDSMDVDGRVTPVGAYSRSPNSSTPATPSIIISDGDSTDANLQLSLSSPPGTIASIDAKTPSPASKRALSSSTNRSPKKNSTPVSSNGSSNVKKAPETPQLPPKQPKQASPTVRPRRTRKVRMYDPYSDKASHPLSQPLQACLEILQELMDHEYGWVFNTPVDPIMLNIPDYFDIIKNPMDLGTIKTQLQSGHYETPEEFAADVRLVWSNALTYNSAENDVHLLAKQFQKSFEKAYARVEADWERNKEKYLAANSKRNRPKSTPKQATPATTTTATSDTAESSQQAEAAGDAMEVAKPTEPENEGGDQTEAEAQG